MEISSQNDEKRSSEDATGRYQNSFYFFSVSLQNTWCKKDKQESQVNDICNKYLLE